MDIQDTIQTLRKELNQHNHNYYVLDKPTISDFEFDLKLKQLQDLENQHPEYYDENSPTQRVGGAITKNFQTVPHEHRMYSLDNSYSKDELLDWEKRIQKVFNRFLRCYIKIRNMSFITSVCTTHLFLFLFL